MKHEIESRLTLRRGDAGQDVHDLQTGLAHFYFLKTVNINDGFDLATETAVREFQHAEGLAVDGVVGPQTWTALNSALAKKG